MQKENFKLNDKVIISFFPNIFEEKAVITELNGKLCVILKDESIGFLKDAYEIKKY